MDAQESTNCYKESFIHDIKQTSKNNSKVCTIAALKLAGIGENDEICKGDPKKLWMSFWLQASESYTKAYTKCGHTCSQITYTIEKVEAHRNFLSNFNIGSEDNYVLWIKYADLKVDTKSEKKVYEIDQAIVALGGLGGLFLGLSFLTIINFMIDFNYKGLFQNYF